MGDRSFTWPMADRVSGTSTSSTTWFWTCSLGVLLTAEDDSILLRTEAPHLHLSSQTTHKIDFLTHIRDFSFRAPCKSTFTDIRSLDKLLTFKLQLKSHLSNPLSPSSHPVPAPHIRSTILALYKSLCMYVYNHLHGLLYVSVCPRQLLLTSLYFAAIESARVILIPTVLKAGMVHSLSGWTRGVQIKLWDPLRTRAIPERLIDVFTTRRYTNTRLPLPLPLVLPFHIPAAFEVCCPHFSTHQFCE